VEKKNFAAALARLKKPEERWRTHEKFLKSHGLFTRSGRKAFGYQ